MLTAQAVFKYPLVGRIIFRQPQNEPESDTAIIIENLIHADGSALNHSAEHRSVMPQLKLIISQIQSGDINTRK